MAWNNLQCFLKHRTILKNPRFKGASLLYLPVIADSLKKENVIQTEGKIAEVEEQEEIVIEEDAVVVTQKKKPGRKRKQDETHAAGVEELVEKDEKEKRKPGRRRKDETNTPKKQFISNDENKPPKIFTRE